MARDLRMTNVKNEKFHAKIIKIAYFELQKSYIPQKKSENICIIKVQQEKVRFPARKYIFYNFFQFSRHT